MIFRDSRHVLPLFAARRRTARLAALASFRPWWERGLDVPRKSMAAIGCAGGDCGTINPCSGNRDWAPLKSLGHLLPATLGLRVFWIAEITSERFRPSRHSCRGHRVGRAVRLNVVHSVA